MEPIIIVKQFVETYNIVDQTKSTGYINNRFIDVCITELKLSHYNSDMIHKLINILEIPNSFLISLMELKQWSIINNQINSLIIIETYNGIKDIDWKYGSTPDSKNEIFINLNYFKKIITVQGDKLLFSYLSAIYAGLQLLQYKLKMQKAIINTTSALDAFARISLTKCRSLSDDESDGGTDSESDSKPYIQIDDNQEYFII